MTNETTKGVDPTSCYIESKGPSRGTLVGLGLVDQVGLTSPQGPWWFIDLCPYKPLLLGSSNEHSHLKNHYLISNWLTLVTC